MGIEAPLMTDSKGDLFEKFYVLFSGLFTYIKKKPKSFQNLVFSP